MFRVTNVHKRFENNEVLKGVDLEVEKGDVIVILGPSGSGKTTLLRCINFLEKADSGQMQFNEDNINLHHASKGYISKIRKQTAFVFQNYNLLDRKSVV